MALAWTPQASEGGHPRWWIVSPPRAQDWKISVSRSGRFSVSVVSVDGQGGKAVCGGFLANGAEKTFAILRLSEKIPRRVVR